MSATKSLIVFLILLCGQLALADVQKIYSDDKATSSADQGAVLSANGQYLFLTKKPAGHKLSSSTGSNLLRKSIVPDQALNPLLLQEFQDGVGQSPANELRQESILRSKLRQVWIFPCFLYLRRVKFRPKCLVNRFPHFQFPEFALTPSGCTNSGGASVAVSNRRFISTSRLAKTSSSSEGGASLLGPRFAPVICFIA